MIEDNNGCTKWVVFLIILVLSYLTNPNDLRTHQQAFRKKRMEQQVGVNESNSPLDNTLSTMKNFDKAIMINASLATIAVDDLYFFSITKFNGEAVGIGAFGFVHIF